MSRSLVAEFLVPRQHLGPRDLHRTIRVLEATGHTFEGGSEGAITYSGAEARRVPAPVGEATRALASSEEWGTLCYKPSLGGGTVEFGLSVTSPAGGPCRSVALAAEYPGAERDSPYLLAEFVASAKLLAELVRPWYGWVGADVGVWGYVDREVRGAQPAAGVLEPLEWLNVYGEPFIIRYGARRLLAAPAWRTEILANGCITVMLGSHPGTYDRGVARGVAWYLGTPEPDPEAIHPGLRHLSPFAPPGGT